MNACDAFRSPCVSPPVGADGPVQTGSGRRALALTLALAATCLAQPAATTPAPEGPKVVRLSVGPAAEPRPALAYRLLPGPLDCRKGNAALMYFRVITFEAQRGDTKWVDQVNGWLDLPIDELPHKDVAALLSEHGPAFRELQIAARSSRCDWELPLKEEGFGLLLPELSQFRSLAKLIALKARLEIARGQLDEAVATLQIGFAMARHVAEQDLLISNLVGIAIGSLMAERLEELIERPGSPNLYWAVAHLPRPLIDIGPAMATEASWLYLSEPALRVDWRHATAPQAADAWAAMNRLMKTASGEQALSGPLARTATALVLYEPAKQFLIAAGRSPKEVEAMPVTAVVVIYMMSESERWRDEMFKWFALPYWQAQQGIRRTERRFEQWLKTPGGRVNPAGVLLPAVSRALFVHTRLERQLAALQCIEAARMYAAGHDGRPPASLDELRDAPVPIDPVTGKPFVYAAEGATFTIDAPAPPDMPAKDGRRYVVTLIRPTDQKGAH